jgi:hypothetical protein
MFKYIAETFNSALIVIRQYLQFLRVEYFAYTLEIAYDIYSTTGFYLNLATTGYCVTIDAYVWYG